MFCSVFTRNVEHANVTMEAGTSPLSSCIGRFESMTGMRIIQWEHSSSFPKFSLVWLAKIVVTDSSIVQLHARILWSPQNRRFVAYYSSEQNFKLFKPFWAGGCKTRDSSEWSRIRREVASNVKLASNVYKQNRSKDYNFGSSSLCFCSAIVHTG